MIYFKKFCEHIKKETFINSIHNIKNAVSSIWTKDAKIVQDYTDHGPEHSERIFEKLYDLLLIDNAIESLKEEELYILILSVILHDIGMQCDVKKHDAIKNVAEKILTRISIQLLYLERQIAIQRMNKTKLERIIIY